MTQENNGNKIICKQKMYQGDFWMSGESFLGTNHFELLKEPIQGDDILHG